VIVVALWGIVVALWGIFAALFWIVLALWGIVLAFVIVEEERRKREHEEEQQAKRYWKNEQRKMRDRERATIKKQLANAHIAQAGIVEDAAEPEPIAEEGPHCVRDVTGQFVPGTVDGEAAAAVDAAPSAAAVAEAEEPTQVAATDAAVAGQQQAEVSEPVTMVRITPGCQANPILQILMC